MDQISWYNYMDHREFPDTSRRWMILNIIQTSQEGPDNKEDGYIYYIFLAPRESETTVLRYRNKHLQEPLQKPNHIQLMELRAKTIRWKIRLAPQSPLMEL